NCRTSGVRSSAGISGSLKSMSLILGTRDPISCAYPGLLRSYHGRAVTDWLVEDCFPAHHHSATRQDWQATRAERIWGPLLLLARTVLVQKGKRRRSSQ